MKVHSWEIDGRYKVDLKLRNKIREGIRKNYGSLPKWEQKHKLSDYHHRKLHEKFTRSDILFNLIDSARISRYEAEKNITEVWLWNKMYYRISFPYEVTSTHVRIASHVVGDGSMRVVGKCIEFSWGQNNIAPLKELQEKLLGLELSASGKTINISKFIMKVVCSALNMDVNKFTKEEFLTRTLSLPKEFRIQVLTAIIEDESTIEKYRIVIRLKSKKLIEIITKLIDSLGYERSTISSSIYKNDKYEILMYRISLNSLGLRKYYHDLENMKINYCKLSLWTKDKALKNCLITKERLIGYRKNRELCDMILRKCGNDLIIPNKLIKTMKLKPNRIYSTLRYMHRKGHIQKVNKGLYRIDNRQLW